MPEYRVTAPDGRQFKVTGDRPPSEAELSQLLAEYQPTSAASAQAPVQAPAQASEEVLPEFYEPRRETPVEQGVQPGGMSLMDLAGAPALTAAREAITQAGTLYAADEISGLTRALLRKARGDERPLGEMYREYTDQRREEVEQARQASPYAFGAAEVATGMTGGGAAPQRLFAEQTGRRLNVLRQAGRAGAESAAIGAAAGAGMSEAETFSDFLRDAGFGGAFGFTLGSISGAASARGQRRPAKVRSALEAADVTEKEIADEIARNPNLMPIDIVPQLREMAKEVPSRQLLRLTQQRLGSAKDTMQQRVQKLSEQVRPMYERVYSRRPRVNLKVWQDLNSRPDFKKAWRQAVIDAANEGVDVSSNFTMRLDYTQRALRTMADKKRKVSGVIKPGEKDNHRRVTRTRDLLLREMDKDTEYAEARKLYANEMSLQRAYEQGLDEFKNKTYYLDPDLPEAERLAYLAGRDEGRMLRTHNQLSTAYEKMRVPPSALRTALGSVGSAIAPGVGGIRTHSMGLRAASQAASDFSQPPIVQALLRRDLLPGVRTANTIWGVLPQTTPVLAGERD